MKNIEERQYELERDYKRKVDHGSISQETTVTGIANEALKGIIFLRDKYKRLSESDEWYHTSDTLLWNNVYCDLDKLVKKIESF